MTPYFLLDMKTGSNKELGTQGNTEYATWYNVKQERDWEIRKQGYVKLINTLYSTFSSVKPKAKKTWLYENWKLKTLNMAPDDQLNGKC